MKTSEKLRKLAAKIRERSRIEKRIKSAQVAEGITALKRLEKALSFQEK